MTRTVQIILIVYCVLVVCAVLVVPWSYTRGDARFDTEYAFLLSDMDRKSVDYGRVTLELVALSGLAAITYLLRDHLERLPVVFARLRQQAGGAFADKDPLRSPDLRISLEKSSSQLYWEQYWNARVQFCGFQVPRRWRFAILAILCLLIVVTVLGTLSSRLSTTAIKP